VAMKMLVARKKSGSYRYVVHLDITMLLADGTTPDPAWCFEQSWQKPANGGLTNWQAGIRADLLVLCVAQLAALVDAADPGVALLQEGLAFP
jgi:hypothetical protein